MNEDGSMDFLLRTLMEDEQTLIEAVDELEKCQKEEQRLRLRVDGLRKMIEIWSSRND